MPLFPLCSTSEQNGKRRQMEAADPPGAEPEKNCLRSHKHTCGTLPPSVLSIILLVPALRSLSLPRPHIAVSQKAADVTHYLQQRPCCSGNRGEGVDGLPSVFFEPRVSRWGCRAPLATQKQIQRRCQATLSQPALLLYRSNKEVRSRAFREAASPNWQTV